MTFGVPRWRNEDRTAVIDLFASPPSDSITWPVASILGAIIWSTLPCTLHVPVWSLGLPERWAEPFFPLFFYHPACFSLTLHEVVEYWLAIRHKQKLSFDTGTNFGITDEFVFKIYARTQFACISEHTCNGNHMRITVDWNTTITSDCIILCKTNPSGMVWI